MRKELYVKIAEALLSLKGEDDEQLVKYVNMWNQNVEFIDEESPWERPAVFVEFMPIDWQRIKDGSRMVCHACSQLKLHIVTDFKGEYGASDVENIPTTELEQFDLPDKIARAMVCLNGDHFGNVMLLESTSNHNHSEIVEVVDTYKYDCEMFL